MHDEMMEWMQDPNCCCNEMNGDDQSIHNYLFYQTDKLSFATAVPNRMGIVNTVGVQGAKIKDGEMKMMMAMGKSHDEARDNLYKHTNNDNVSWIGTQYGITDTDGFFTNFDESRSRVVHQYDRLGPVEISAKFLFQE